MRMRHALAVPDTAPLFPALHAELVTLLRALRAEDWDRPTVAGAWRVRDVAMHLLDGELRVLAAHRDGHQVAPERPIKGYADVLALIHGLNKDGVAFGRRLSPRLLTDLLDVSGRWMGEFVRTLDPEGPALFPVAWAGESVSTNRMDTAREYTERWHHQMQMRDALDGSHDGAMGTNVLLADSFLAPLLDTAVRVLPHAYRDVSATEGSTVVLALRDAAWTRTLRREGDGWALLVGAPEEPATTRALTTRDVLWRHFFNALPADAARAAFTVEGDADLLRPFWSARSVMV